MGVLKLVHLDIPESLEVIGNIAVFDMFCLCSNQIVCITREELERGKGKSADSNGQETGFFCFAMSLLLCTASCHLVCALTIQPKQQLRTLGRLGYPR